MSDVGLNSNIYDISSRYLEMLNQYLVEANYAPAMVNQDLIKRVHAFLHQLLDKSNRDFQVQMVEQVIEAYLQKEQKEKADVFLRNLLTHFDRKTMTDPDALRRIAILTDALDEECDESYSRIRLGK